MKLNRFMAVYMADSDVDARATTLEKAIHEASEKVTGGCSQYYVLEVCKVVRSGKPPVTITDFIS